MGFRRHILPLHRRTLNLTLTQTLILTLTPNRPNPNPNPIRVRVGVAVTFLTLTLTLTSRQCNRIMSVLTLTPTLTLTLTLLTPIAASLSHYCGHNLSHCTLLSAYLLVITLTPTLILAITLSLNRFQMVSSGFNCIKPLLDVIDYDWQVSFCPVSTIFDGQSAWRHRWRRAKAVPTVIMTHDFLWNLLCWQNNFVFDQSKHLKTSYNRFGVVLSEVVAIYGMHFRFKSLYKSSSVTSSGRSQREREIDYYDYYCYYYYYYYYYYHHDDESGVCC